MLSETKFYSLVTCFGLKSIFAGGLVIGGFTTLAAASWLGIVMILIGIYVGCHTKEDYSKILEHSRAQNRAIQILTKQLTSDGEEPTL